MKKTALSIITCLSVAASAFAGHEMRSSKEYKGGAAIPEPCFKDVELQLDVFASYTNTQGGGYSDGFGGGIAVNYFFMRYVGVGVDGNLFDGGANGVWDTTGRVILRYPIESGSFCIAPYAFGGGGYEVDGEGVGTLHAGAGLEFRVNPKLGIFGEGRYTWADEQDNGDDNDAVQARVGVRFVF